MKTSIHAARKPKRSFVPMTGFAFESFEIRVRQASRDRPLQSKAAFRKVDKHHHSKASKVIARPIDAAPPGKIFLPAPMLEGQRLTLWRFGARPVVHPTPLSSAHASPPSQCDENAGRQLRHGNETQRATFTIISLVPEAIAE